MIIARIQHDSASKYSALEGDCLKIIRGDIFGSWSVTDETLSLKNTQLLSPVKPSQVIAIGLNYHDHAKECDLPIPKEPLIFLKGVNTITGPNTNIILPFTAPNEVDYEAELVIVIGKQTKNVSEEEANDHILGYTCGNDVSARDCQLKRDSQWARGKSFDTFAPIGPWIVTDIDPDNLDIKLNLNNKTMQQSNTSNMIFSCRKLVSFVSHCMTLYPGSIIMTGTPPGIGLMRKPSVFLKVGDRIEVEIENVGKLSNIVKMES